MDGGNALNLGTSKRENLVNELKDPAYRHAFIEAHAKDTVAFQLRRMREAKGWTQGELAQEAFGDPKLQSMVSRLENPDYGKYSVSTLLGLAKVFDVGLVVRFAPFSEVVDWDLNKTEPTLEPPPFAQDVALETHTPLAVTTTAVTNPKQTAAKAYVVSVIMGHYKESHSSLLNRQLGTSSTTRRPWQQRRKMNNRRKLWVKS